MRLVERDAEGAGSNVALLALRAGSISIGVAFIASCVIGQADSQGAVGRVRGEWWRWRGGLRY